MKRIYQRLKFSALLFIIAAKFSFACVIILLASSFASYSQELVFKNPTLVSGSAGQNNAVYRFPKVTSAVDALLKVKKRSANNVVIQNIDVTDFGWNKAFQPQIGISGGIVSGIKDWWVEFEISFVKTGTSDEADVSEFNLTSLDVDGDNLTIREYVELYDAASYYFEGGTELVHSAINDEDEDDDDDEPKKKNYRFLGPIKNYLDIDTLGTRVMVTSKFVKKDKIKFRIGARAVGLGSSNAAIRYNSLWFRSFSYVSGTFLPVKLTSFTVKSVEKNKIALNWNTAQEKNSSHFTIEKSLNGKDFSDAGIIFSMGNSEQPQQYSFTDVLRTGEQGLIYYRLKMVDIDGQSQYSPIKVIRIGEEKANASVLVYPNPVANELRITLPSTWHDKKVTIDIYTTNGILAKRFVTNNASQTETINVRALTPGSYMIRSSNGSDTTSQQIIKTN
ncbi:MAG: T9SS type A sorting domain-containing protein [Chitinophagaceae bacterium]|nr:T9SS type A sorting domain-containing protein [Chitinophagaceae bacterium]